MADNYTLRVRQGDDKVLILTYEDHAGTAINITGYTFEFSYTVDGVTTLVTSSPVITVPTPTNGQIVLTLSGALTATFISGRGRYYFKATAPEKKTFLIGELEVEFNE